MIANPALRGAADCLTPVEEADVELAVALGQKRNSPVVRGAGALSEVGDQPPLFVIASAVVATGSMAGRRRVADAGAHMFGSALFASLFKTALKRVISRTHPHMLLEEGRYEVRCLRPNEGRWQSFPSGHTAGSGAFARAVSRLYPAVRLPACACAGTIGVIQIPRGPLYPPDVIAGVLLGVAAEEVAAAIRMRALLPARNARLLGGDRCGESP